MRNSNIRILGLTTVLAAAMTFGTGISAQASDQTDGKNYTVTFRAGNVGTFDTARISSQVKGVTVTDNYIKFEVKRGESLSQEYAAMCTDDATWNSELSYCVTTNPGYGLKNITDWGKDATTQTITRNTEYVLDYVKIVNPVEYTITYVDASSGEQIAAPMIAYGEADQEITAAPLTIDNYSTTATASILKLQKGTENKISFSYSYTGPRETVTNIVTRYVEGTTYYQNQTREITTGPEVGTANNAAGVNGAAGANGEVLGASREKAKQNSKADQSGQNGTSNTQEDAKETAAKENTEQGDTAASTEAAESTTPTVTIGDEDTALAKEAGTTHDTQIIVLLICILAASIAAIAFYLIRKNPAAVNSTDHADDNDHKDHPVK